MKPFNKLTWLGRIRRMRQRHPLPGPISGSTRRAFIITWKLFEWICRISITARRTGKHVELFLAALQVYWNQWATGGTHLYPDLQQEYVERMSRTIEYVVRYVRQEGGLHQMEGSPTRRIR